VCEDAPDRARSSASEGGLVRGYHRNVRFLNRKKSTVRDSNHCATLVRTFNMDSIYSATSSPNPTPGSD
jgi:hypothetical protein